MPSTTIALVAVPLLFITYCLGRFVYNVWFHPLRNFPGPKLWTGTKITRHFYSLRGEFDIQLRSLHNTYGEVVRYQPDALSFITAAAWNDIYGGGHKQVPKDTKFYVLPASTNDGVDIFTAIDDSDHSRMRRAISHAFSEKALREQEPTLKKYVDRLIEKLEECADSNIPVDLCKWYNYAAFDLIGDLTFGESFHCLEKSDYHPFVGFVFERFRSRPWLNVAQDYSLAKYLLAALLPRAIREGRAAVSQYARNATLKRLERGTNRKDFFSYILRGSDEKTKLSEAEIIANSRTLIIAGSESSATVLAGTTFWLLKTPAALARATREVRERFASEEEISIITTPKLQYTMACIEEGLRLFPSGPTALPRRLRETTAISGFVVPKDTSVAVHHSAAYWSPLNFHLPQLYCPERWLPAESVGTQFEKDNRAVLQPFSVGPRNCVGRNLGLMEVRMILASMLWHFDMELYPESASWTAGMKAYIMWDKPPLMAKLKKRAHIHV